MKITLRPVIFCTIAQQMQLRELRNSIDVRKYMYTDHIIGVNEHLCWVAGLENDTSVKSFIVFDENHLVKGFVAISNIDINNKRCSWAFYLDPLIRGGLGAAIEYWLIEYVFEVLKMEKLTCEVLECNAPVIKLHNKFGFELEGKKIEEIIRNGDRVSVKFFGLLKSRWIESKSIFLSQYGDILNKFNIELNEDRPEWDAVLKKIQSARAKNNVNWMALLKLSIESSAEQSTSVIEEILRIDREISDLTVQLIDTKKSCRE